MHVVVLGFGEHVVGNDVGGYPGYNLKVARGFSWAKMGFFASLPFFVGLLGLITAGIIADRLKKAGRLMNCT